MTDKRIQKEIWHREHLTSETLPSLAQADPSDSVIKFVDHLKKHALLDRKKVVDIGCGKGRNALYLAQMGLEVYAFDFIGSAIRYAQNKAQQQHIDHKIHFSEASMDLPWNFPDNHFDFALDCFASIDIETKQGRDVYKNELFRTLKPGGLALVCVVAASDEFEAELIKNNPGAEPNSSLWPQNGKFQKNYDERELKNFYASFSIVDFQVNKKKAIKLNREFMATNYWLLLQKPLQ